MAPERAPADQPHVVVLSSLFPSAVQPVAGVFIRERMFRVGRRLPLAVVAPTPWFPLQRLIARWRPGFRPGAPHEETQFGTPVWYPRYFSTPGMLKRLDGWFMAVGAWPRLRALRRAGRLHVLDAHFGYPDGFAATLLGRWLKVPVTITMRGTESRHAQDPALRPLLAQALQRADRVFAVSESLRQVALGLGVPPERVRVVGNGVDLERFTPVDRTQARAALGLPASAPVLVSVGGLCERKGFHRVIACLPALHDHGTPAHLLVVGGPSPEGDMTAELKAQVQALGLSQHVHFTGPVPPADLHRVLSAADVFVLATRNEGWANVFLEAMACGLPVVTTAVGGNAEVVCRPELGTVVPFGDAAALTAAMHAALGHAWDTALIRQYAQANTWDRRVEVLEAEFRALCRAPASGVAPATGPGKAQRP
ncbi:MAG: glycosyltransferase [Burkholderiaceae bacterium]|jgi:glycosyltransferase involved in cell wall biosynthesis|nr:glycosyltransferase [Burkholderiaceae bacterium]MCU0964382.1 glycosyltransferase [Burkholderiaceae bacterium]